MSQSATLFLVMLSEPMRWVYILTSKAIEIASLEQRQVAVR